MFVVEPGYIRFFTPFWPGPGTAFFLGILPQQAFRSLFWWSHPTKLQYGPKVNLGQELDNSLFGLDFTNEVMEIVEQRINRCFIGSY